MTELAKRVRAARAYAALSQAQLAERVGLDTQTVKRMEAGRRDPKLAEQWAIAEVCAVPREFFTERAWVSDDGQLDTIRRLVEGIDETLHDEISPGMQEVRQRWRDAADARGAEPTVRAAPARPPRPRPPRDGGEP